MNSPAQQNRDTLELPVHPHFRLPLQASLESFYLQQVCTNLKKIEKAIARWRRAGNDVRALKRMKDSSLAIFDFAMVHGYDGVENMALKLQQTVDFLIQARERYNSTIAAKLKSAVLAIRQVVEMEAENERQMTIENVSRCVEATHEEVQSRTEQLAESFEPIVKVSRSQPHASPSEHSPWFDISEHDTLIRLTEELDLPDPETAL
ncbi:MAG TPA: hypothetical protein VGA99_05235 [bacterium]